MSQEQWTAVDHYINGLLLPPNAVLDAALTSSVAAGLPAISVTPNQGKFLAMLAQVQGARRILELGTLGGYSTIWLASALPANGCLISLEAVPEYAELARANLARAGFADVVEVRVGLALDLLERLVAERCGPFDFIFIDADKENYADYFVCALKLARRGTVIIADNVVRDGTVIDPNTPDPRVQGVRRFYELVAAEPRVTATAIQTVGGKGYDGFAMVMVSEGPNDE